MKVTLDKMEIGVKAIESLIIMTKQTSKQLEELKDYLEEIE